MEELKEIIKKLKEITKEAGLKVKDKYILENGVKIYLSQYIQQSKEKNIQKFKESQILHPGASGLKSASNKDIPATEKQLELLKKLEYNGNMENLTKSEAYHLIQNYYKKDKNAKQNY